MFTSALVRISLCVAALVAACRATAVAVEVDSGDTARIVGGSQLPSRFAPYVARLEVTKRLDNNQVRTQLCTGVVTSTATVLGAARCFVQRKQGKVIRNKIISVKVYVGLIDLDEKNTWSQTYEADEVYIHHQYGEVKDSTLTSNYDLTVIFLDDDLPSDYPTVALANYDLPKNKTVYVSGWGAIDDVHRVKSDVLRFVMLRIRPFDKCTNELPAGIKPRFNPQSVLCASSPSWRRGGKSMCGGDQGAPLFTVRKGKMTVHGIAISTPACGASKTGQFYSYVNNFRTDIQAIVSETDYSAWNPVYQ